MYFYCKVSLYSGIFRLKHNIAFNNIYLNIKILVGYIEMKPNDYDVERVKQ